MNQYKAKSVVTIYEGNLTLSENQAKRRYNQVSDNKDGTYKIESQVQFKAGETFGYDGDIPKAYLMSVQEEGQTKPKKLAKKPKDVSEELDI